MILKLVNLNKYFAFFLFLGSFAMIIGVFSSISLAANNLINIQEDRSGNIHFNNAIAATTGVSPATINLVKHYEGFRSYAYMDTSGHPVIGYGQSRINGRKVRIGQRISRAEADAALVTELYNIQRLVESKVKVKLNPNQLGALTSLVYNAGIRIVTNSTLIRKLNSGDYQGAADEFLRWNKAHQRGRLVPLAGLTRRRQAERQLFLTPYR